MYGTEVIRYHLTRDVVDSTPQAIAALYPTVFASSSVVPDYEWKSLKSIWLGTSAASGDFANIVSAKTGAIQDSGAKGGIAVVLESFYPSYSPNIPHAMKSDDSKAYSAIIRIILFQPKVRTQADVSGIVSNAATRVTMILDQYLRNERRLKPAALTSSGDTSLSSDYFKCFLIEGHGPGAMQRVSDSAIELVFRVEFKKIIV